MYFKGTAINIYLASVLYGSLMYNNEVVLINTHNQL